MLRSIFRDIHYDMDKIIAAIEKACHEEMVREQEENAECYRKYISIMRNLGWPAYLNPDTDFHEEIVDLFEAGEYEKLEKAIIDHYDHLYLVDLEKALSDSCVIRGERVASLSQALLLYQLRYYYGAVAIITPQLIGIVRDLEIFMETNSLDFNPVNISEIESGCGLEVTSEKGRILKAVLEGRDINDEQGEYDHLSNYLRFKVFENKMSPEDTGQHVNRHLLSHGIQVNYGTRNHALRVIMCLDALVYITQVIAEEYEVD